MTLRRTLVMTLLCSTLFASAPLQARQVGGATVAPEWMLLLPQQETVRPPVTTSAVLSMTAAGTAGGLAGLTVVGVPMIFAAFAGVPKPSDAAIVGSLGGAVVAGTTLGVHWGGRRHGMKAQPLATLAGVVVGAGLVGLSGIALVSDDPDFRSPRWSLALAPALGGTGGYLLTRRFRER